MSEPVEPYLSVVVTSRNDDHGGNLLRRMQIFVNTLCDLAARHDVCTELIVVEWNPPENRPGLKEAIDWSGVRAPLSVRLIDAPARVHASFAHSDALPLYQMIAKNAGIRRSRGRFVLATNIDIVFSSELFEMLAGRTLDAARMYRIDRHDVDSGVPLEATLDERLRYCASHVLRVNAYDGCHPCAPDGRRLAEAGDIVDPEGPVFLGSGWHELVGAGRSRFRWAGERAEVIVCPPDAHTGLLKIHLAPGPGVGFEPFTLRVTAEPGGEIYERPIRGTSRLSLFLPFSETPRRRIRLEALEGGRAAHESGDDRILNFRVSRIAWTRATNAVDGRMAADALKVERVAPIEDAIRRLARASARKFAQSMPHGAAAPQLHINACGDFTLMAREAWFDLRGYPEFDCFSMNLDAVLCFAADAAGYKELALSEPLRIYHIDHSAGSGFGPEEQEELHRRITAKGIPWLSSAELHDWARQMRRLSAPILFNHENWGLSDHDFSEWTNMARQARIPG